MLAAKTIAVRLARWARVPRAAPSGRSILSKGLFRPLLNSPGSRALPYENPATLPRGGRACGPQEVRGAVPVAFCVCGQTPGLTLAGQTARILDDARSGLGVPRSSPSGRVAWTARAGGARPEGLCL